MSVLIKGVDMPKKCCECIFARDSGLGKDMVACIAVQGMVGVPKRSGKSEACPLVEVKTPHGRLIDESKLSAEMYHEAFETDSELQKWDSGCWIRYKMYENASDHAPTVIESED